MASLRERYAGYALITGASSGIGESFARKLAAEKLDLVLVARSRDKLEEQAQALKRQHGVEAVAVAADLAEPGGPEQVHKAVEARGLQVGLLINNAGVGAMGPFHEVERARHLQLVDLNCRAVVDLTSLFLPAMVERRRGGIIIVSSVGGFQALPNHATYAATKAFDLLLAEALWAELRPEGIDVLGLAPGYTRTNFGTAAGAAASGEGGFAWASADDVVDTALAALGKQPSVIHGRANRLVVALTALLPRRLSVELANRVSKSRLD